MVVIYNTGIPGYVVHRLGRSGTGARMERVSTLFSRVYDEVNYEFDSDDFHTMHRSARGCGRMRHGHHP